MYNCPFLFLILQKLDVMPEFTVSIENTSNPSIIKFEVDQFITDRSSYEFENIDAAKNSPLAQQLFHLPFVKTIYISGNFIAIERFDNVEWPDVQEEVRQQINDYLNQGGKVIAEPGSKLLPVTIYAESTPNPSALKFVANKRLVDQMVEFSSAEEAGTSNLVAELFSFPFLTNVFIDENYVSLTKNEMVEWLDVTNELREFIRDYLQKGGQVIDSDAMAATKQKIQPPDVSNLDPTSREIVQILDEFVKPAVASDGGNIQFESYDPGTKQVRVILQGACSGCPSSTVTLKEMLKDKVESVEAING